MAAPTKYHIEIGDVFGKWTVIDKEIVVRKSGYKVTKYICRCECGNISHLEGCNLGNGHSQGCKTCAAKARANKYGPKHFNYKHGMSDSRLYTIWVGMKDRCSNPNATRYNLYGGRGISVCDEWQKFEPFMEWSLSHGYSDSLELDRIDTNGNYCPENCHYVTTKENMNNKRNNRHLTYDGRTQTLSQWADEMGCLPSLIEKRLNAGWSEEKAISTPSRTTRIKTYTVDGETHTLSEWCKIRGVSKATIASRLYLGWDIESAILTPVNLNLSRTKNRRQTHSNESDGQSP